MDLSDPVPLVKAILPKVPLMGKTAIWHTLGLSDTSKDWDLRTELIVNVLRSFIITPEPQSVSKTQSDSLKDPGIKGMMWISKVTMPKPEEDGIREALFKAIDGLRETNEAPGGYTEPALLPVEAEWTGHRADATSRSPDVMVSESEKYAELMREATSPITILYFHGGAYYLMDPSSHRPTTSRLAKLTKGRCLSVRYRLAPQNPFPAALLDALVSYFSLLYPPNNAIHAPVEARHIVFSGDSAGGNLAIVLLQTLLELRRQGLKVRWNGEDRDVPLPAGVACNSGWMDITHSSPSCESNAKWDYLPARSLNPQGMAYKKCDLWPTSPPRRNIYAEDAVLCHPLVSPLAAKSWEGSCPLWIETGQELLTDEDKAIAAKAAKQGVPVVFEEYAAMPHCFAMVLEGLPGGRRCFEGWAKFIKDVVERPESVVTKGVYIEARTLKETEVDVEALGIFTDEEILQRMRARVKALSEEDGGTLARL